MSGERGGEPLATEKIPRLVLKFTGTTLVALLLNAAYTLTDTLFVSWGVGDSAVGSVSVAFPFVILQGAISTAIGGGAASLVARRLGTGEREQAGAVTRCAMMLFYGSAVVITILGLLLMDPVLHLLGVTAEIYDYSRDYLTIILLGNVFSTGFSSIIRAEGKMLYGLLIWVIPISINIILDAVFVLVLGWGVRGSALATVACQFASFTMCVIFFLRLTTQQFRGTRFRWRTAGAILAVGIPSLIQMGSLSVISALVNHFLGDVAGTSGITAFAYISKIVTFAVVPITAVSQALAPIVGYNYGAGENGRVRQTVRYCIRVCLIYALAAFVLLETIPDLLIHIFTADAQIIALSASGLRIIAISLFFMVLPMLMGAYFQAVGNKGWALFLYAANLIFLFPLAAVFSKLYGLNGVWLSYVLANGCAAVVAVAKIIWMRRRSSAVDN